MIGRLQILPIKVVVLYASIHKFLGRVGKAGSWDDSVAAVRMLSRLLQVDDGFHVFVFELLQDVILGDQSIRGALGADEEIGDAL